MKTLFKNIKELLQVRETPISFLSGTEMSELPTIKNAFLLVENDKIIDFGTMENCPQLDDAEIVDVTGKMIHPTWCDSHTHIVYAGNREGEFVDRIKGLSYEEIAQKGGGILNSAKKLQTLSEEELYEQSKVRLEEVIQQGTGAVEIKSGYGLTADAELKMLRVIQRMKKEYPIPIKATFLGAHAVPANYKGRKSEYLQMLIDEVLPQISKEKLADFVDIFCEKGYFDLEDTERIIKAGVEHNLIPKIHVNQFNAFGGVGVGVKYNALSVDHLEEMNEEDYTILKGSKTMPVALPACSFFITIPYTPARKIIDSGLPLALASDYNPGTAPTGNMNFVMATACIKMQMTPEEAFNASTINGAYAMNLEKEVGSITKGKRANFIITKPIHSYNVIPYQFATNHIETIYINGKEITF
ncbi:MAG: imidazolonepropionase [Flavobacteriaceae bacterium]|nr:imidazolonepropionase [Flavobacteriaceae bacterium]